MIKININLGVKDVKKSVDFYKKLFNFELLLAVSETKEPPFDRIEDEKEYLYALLGDKKVEIMFQQMESLCEDTTYNFDNKPNFTGTLYFETEDIENYLKRLKGVEIVKELDTTWYGMREIYIKDLDGYIIALSEKVDEFN